MSNGIGRVWAVNAEGGDEGRPNGVGPVYIENADKLGSKLPEPAAGDTGKVLGVLNAEGDLGWVVDREGMAQVQADWDQTDSSQVSYIANKPTLATVATSGSYADLSNKPTIPTVDQVYDSTSTNAQSGVAVAGAISSKQDTISDLSTIRSGAAAGATAVQPSQLATVATSGSYADLTNKPSIPAAQVNSDWNAASGVAEILNKPTLSTVATTGDYSDLLNKPTIPAAQVQSDWNQTNDQAVDFIKNKPTIPAGVVVDQSYSASSTNAQSGTAVAQAIAAIPSSSYTAGDGIDITANEVSVRAGRNLGFEAQSTTVTLQSPTTSGNKYAFLGKLDADTVAALKSGTVSLTPKYDYSVSLSGVVDSGARFAICQSSGYNQPFGNGKWVISNNVVSGAGITYFTLTADTAYTVDFSSLSSKSTGTWTDVEAAPTNFYLALVGYSSQYTLADVVQFGQTSAISYAQNPGDVSTLTIGDPNALYLYAEDQLPSISGNGGKVLKVNAGATAVEWAAETTELPATLGTAGQVLTVNSGATGIEWATPSGGGGSSYTFSSPLKESAGTVSLTYGSATLKVEQPFENRTVSTSLQNGNGYVIPSNASNSYTYTVQLTNVAVPNALIQAALYSGKTVLPILLGDPGYSGYANQWVITHTSLTFQPDGKVSGTFTYSGANGDPDYRPTATSGSNLGNAFNIAFGVFDSASSLVTLDSTKIYGFENSSVAVTAYYGDPALNVKNPVPAVGDNDDNKVLTSSVQWDSASSTLIKSYAWQSKEVPTPTIADATKVLTVNAQGSAEWAAAQSGGNVTDYVATYISSSNKPSDDWCSGLATAMDNGQRIGVFVKMRAFTGSYSSGVVNPYDNNAKIYLPLASAIDKSESGQYTTFVYEYNFFLYDGVNKLKITLTDTWQNQTDTFVWSTPTISQ